MIRIVLLLAVAATVYLWLTKGSSTGWSHLGRWLFPAALAMAALLYVRSPIDLIPDFSPVGFVDDLLMLLGAFWWARRHLRMQPRVHMHAERTGGGERSRRRWDPYEVLGLEPGASSEAITQAYRKQMKRYHPDRVAELGEELQRVAHEKTIEIQRAYDELRS